MNYVFFGFMVVATLWLNMYPGRPPSALIIGILAADVVATLALWAA